MTDWQDIRDTDAIALLAPLSTHPSAEVRQLVALQLAAVAGSAADPRALQALVTLAADSEPEVRAAAARSSYIANEFCLTPDDQAAKNPVGRFVDWRLEDQAAIFSVRCSDVSAAQQLLAILAGFTARQMAHRSDEKKKQPPPDQTNEAAVEALHLPDVILDDKQLEAFDLPRRGTPKDVANIQRESVRLPELLIDE
jgi:hypothetical protein